MPWMCWLERFFACSATRFRAGTECTTAISQLALTCTFATVRNPVWRAMDQWRCASGPGPTAEMEYSPICEATPPRSIGRDHSLTDMNQQLLGSWVMMRSLWSSGHPQSHTMTLASGLPRWTPSSIALFSSTANEAKSRSRQSGQCWWAAPRDPQYVKFS